MKFRFLVILFAFFSTTLLAQNKYAYTADLKNILDDKISMELLTPALKEQEAIFSFPRIIPGSYSEKNFGNYIENFQAFDKEGKRLETKKLNKNQYSIKNAPVLARISYKVNDTWDAPNSQFVFQPGGSNIEAGKNVIMNNHAFFGYFEGYSTIPFEIKINKPSHMYASTHLPVERKNAEQDVLHAKDFAFLADNPVFYCKPDTTSFVVGQSRINVSVYSATNKINSNQIAAYLKPMATALEGFFHGSLPVDSYQFLFYFEDPEKALTDREKGEGGYGALEHNYSSLYFLPEMSLEQRLKSMVNEVASHEFLHILTPLNLHSESIENFDFINPKMSKHLWLYEGVTEYFANLVQVQSGLITEKVFMKNMRDKMNAAEEFGDFSMTVMSERVLEDDYQKKYASVYSRGALIALMLDLLIREKTDHHKTLQTVITELTKKYGPGKPFKDDNFISEFVQASHPDVQNFISRHITGSQALPYKEYFNKLGYQFAENKKLDAYIIGNMGLKYDEDSKAFAFTDVDKKNAFDLKNDDIFVSIENIAVTEENLEDIWDRYFRGNTTTPQLTMVIKRKGKEKTLTNSLYKGYVESKNYIAPAEAPTALQTNMRNKLIKSKN